MDELKNRAGEKLEAIQVAAKTAANSSKSKVQNVCHHTVEAFRKLQEAFLDLWRNDLIVEGRERVVAWSRDAVKRVKEGVPPLSPVILYEELIALFHDRVWRRSMVIFICGACAGGALGLVVGLRVAAMDPGGPHARALLSQPDQSVIYVEDAVAPGAGASEVLVRVQSFSVSSADRAALRGRARRLRSLLRTQQVTVGRGFAGVVLDTGAGVTDLELGDQVWGCVAEWDGGAATELLAISSGCVSRRPRGVSSEAAAAISWAGGTALKAIRHLNYTQDNTKGKRVAVCGASSAEGCALVRLLSRRGAHVTALAPRHAAALLQRRGAQEYVDAEEDVDAGGCAWKALERRALRAGPWDAVILCQGTHTVGKPRRDALLRSTAPRSSLLDLRSSPLLSDRLPTPLAFVFGFSFYSFRILRWAVGLGWQVDWLREVTTLRPALEELTKLVEEGDLEPVLDKVYAPQQFESALSHACSEDAVGATVVCFP